MQERETEAFPHSSPQESGEMIKLTRLSGRPFVLNADRILYLEETPDTIITLDTHERLLVKDRADDVIGRVVQYYRTVRTFGALKE